MKIEKRIERNEQIAITVEAHERTFGRRPVVVASAPGRFHLIGEHTWYFGGKTLSMSIDRFVCVSVSPRDDDLLRFHYVETGENKHISLLALRFRKEDKWTNSIKSVIHAFISGSIIEQGGEGEPPGMPGLDFCVSSPVQPSAGMGITTAMKVAAACAVNELLDLDCPASELLSVMERGNREFLKEQDENHLAENLTAMFSRKGALVLTDHDAASRPAQAFEIVDFSFPGKSVLLVDARVPRLTSWNERSLMSEPHRLLLESLRRPGAGGGWSYEDDRAEVSEALDSVPEDFRRRLYGVINEQRCALDALDALRRGAFPQFARAVNGSHENMRDLYDISCPEIDWILKRLVEINPTPDSEHNPVCCGRITGQGFGRCLYAILDGQNIPEFQKRLSEYTKIFGFRAACFEVRSEDGVIVERL